MAMMSRKAIMDVPWWCSQNTAQSGDRHKPAGKDPNGFVLISRSEC
jgi:hypothetical protein